MHQPLAERGLWLKLFVCVNVGVCVTATSRTVKLKASN